MKGIFLALLEISTFFIFSYGLKINFKQLINLNKILYYWTTFTILTGFWEFFFVYNYQEVISISENLLLKNNHVWNNNYNLTYILPNNFSKIFYAEYGAYADREYMSIDDWSRVIESTHAIFCGFFSFMAIIFTISNNNKEYLICISVAMGSQLMNSILYLYNYFYQTKQINSVNYNSTDFPTGNYLSKRPFMYINILWTIMPLYIIIYILKINIRTNKI